MVVTLVQRDGLSGCLDLEGIRIHVGLANLVHLRSLESVVVARVVESCVRHVGVRGICGECKFLSHESRFGVLCLDVHVHDGLALVVSAHRFPGCGSRLNVRCHHCLRREQRNFCLEAVGWHVVVGVAEQHDRHRTIGCG